MLKRILGNTVVLASGFAPLNMSDHDIVDIDSKYAKSLYEQKVNNETGMDRLYMMYSVDEFGNISPELNAVSQAGFLGLFTGFLYGGFIKSRNAYLNFMESNQATAFKSHLDAKKKLQDTVTLGFGKGGFQWAWRLGLFTSSYVLITTTISVYRGKSSILEYLVAGAATGATYKVSLGLRGVIVGGGLGCVLGGIAGCISLLILKTTGTTMENVRYWQYSIKEKRDEQIKSIYREIEKDEDDPISISHNKQVGERGKTLENIE